MRGFSTELKVGAFAILVLVLLTFMTSKVGSLDWLKSRDGFHVFAHFRNIAGLDKKTKVKVAGVDAGIIEDIVLVGGLARLDIRMASGVKLYSDACASIKATGLLGDKYVDMTIGKKEPLLKDGETIKCIQDTMEVDDLVRNLSNMSGSLDELITKLNKSLTDKDISMVKEIVENMRDATGNFKTLLSENDMRLRETLDNLNGLMAALRGLADKDGPFYSTMENFRVFSEALRDDGPKLVKNFAMATGEISELAQHTSEAMKSLSHIANKIESGEGTIGKILTDEKLYDSITSAVQGVERTISRIDRFKTYIKFRADYLSGVGEAKGVFSVTLRPSKEKYYIIGVVGDPVGSVEVTETTTNGVFLREEKVEKDLELTAHFARRYHNTAFRLGLTESTFGVGADQFFANDRLKFYFDAWDFSDDEEESGQPHLRLGAEYFLFKNIFLSGGYDNFLNSRWSGAYFGAGVMFEDEDFKYLFGSMPSIPGK